MWSQLLTQNFCTIMLVLCALHWGLCVTWFSTQVLWVHLHLVLAEMVEVLTHTTLESCRKIPWQASRAIALQVLTVVVGGGDGCCIVAGKEWHQLPPSNCSGGSSALVFISTSPPPRLGAVAPCTLFLPTPGGSGQLQRQPVFNKDTEKYGKQKQKPIFGVRSGFFYSDSPQFK